jgi:hypothetical protein
MTSSFSYLRQPIWDRPARAKYSAVMESVPTGKLFVTKLAMPLPDRATAPSSAVPSKNSAVTGLAAMSAHTELLYYAGNFEISS